MNINHLLSILRCNLIEIADDVRITDIFLVTHIIKHESRLWNWTQWGSSHRLMSTKLLIIIKRIMQSVSFVRQQPDRHIISIMRLAKDKWIENVIRWQLSLYTLEWGGIRSWVLWKAKVKNRSNTALSGVLAGQDWSRYSDKVVNYRTSVKGQLKFNSFGDFALSLDQTVTHGDVILISLGWDGGHVSPTFIADIHPKSQIPPATFTRGFEFPAAALCAMNNLIWPTFDSPIITWNPVHFIHMASSSLDSATNLRQNDKRREIIGCKSSDSIINIHQFVCFQHVLSLFCSDHLYMITDHMGRCRCRITILLP